MAYEIDYFPGRQLSIHGESYLYFGGTAYLGLQADTTFQELFIANIKKYGTNYGASRKSNVRLTVFEQAETYLAGIVGSEACITLSSGYLAGQLVAQQFHQEPYDCFYAPNTHSALVIRQSRCFESYDELNASLRKRLIEKQSKTPVVFLDAISFSGMNYPDFEGLRQLPLSEIVLIVDDSHGIGIVGPQGGGVYTSLSRLKPKELLVSASLGKGYGVQAGAILGSGHRIGQLTDTDFYGGASPATPAAIATLVQSEAIYKKNRELLQENIDLFLREVDTISRFSQMKDYPVFGFSNVHLTNYLSENKVIVTDFQYPGEEASVRSRIVLTAAHTVDDIHALAKLINSFPE